MTTLLNKIEENKNNFINSFNKLVDSLEIKDGQKAYIKFNNKELIESKLEVFKTKLENEQTLLKEFYYTTDRTFDIVLWFQTEKGIKRTQIITAANYSSRQKPNVRVSSKIVKKIS